MFWFGAIVSSCYIPGLTGAFIATQWPVLSVLLPFGLWRNGPLTAIHWLGLVFIAYATARLWYAPIFNDGVWGLWLIYIMGLSFWLGSTLDSLRGLYAGLAVGASASSAIAIFQALGYSIVPYVSSHPAGLYINSVAQGLVLSLVAVALVSERMWLWVPMLLPGIVLAHSRGAWIALAVGLTAVYVRRLWIFGIVAAAGAPFMLYPPGVGTSDEMRLFIWNSAWHNLSWLGWGPGSFASWLLFYHGVNLYPEYAHNDALQLVFEYGVFAVPAICVFAFALTRTAEREWPVIVAFVAAGCYSMPLWVPATSFLAFMVAGRITRGWAVAWSYRYRSRFYIVPWWSRTDRESRDNVSVVAAS